MKFTAALALATGAAAGAANGTAYTTVVQTAYTTYCPAPTQITMGNKTYTVTEATTLTITDCPCTLTKPVIPGNPGNPGPQTNVPVAPSNTAVQVPPQGSQTGVVTAAADKVGAGIGALAVAGVAALLL